MGILNDTRIITGNDEFTKNSWKKAIRYSMGILNEVWLITGHHEFTGRFMGGRFFSIWHIALGSPDPFFVNYYFEILVWISNSHNTQSSGILLNTIISIMDAKKTQSSIGEGLNNPEKYVFPPQNFTFFGHWCSGSGRIFKVNWEVAFQFTQKNTLTSRAPMTKKGGVLRPKYVFCGVAQPLPNAVLCLFSIRDRYYCVQ